MENQCYAVLRFENCLFEKLIFFNFWDFYTYFLILEKICVFENLNFILDIAWHVWLFDIPNKIKIFQIESRITRTVI